jgi:hypothetical protein
MNGINPNSSTAGSEVFMMDAGPAGGEGRRRKKSRGRNNRRKQIKRPRNNHNHHHLTQPISPFPDERSILGGRVPRNSDRKFQEEGPPDAFDLFCAYYLGITATEGYYRPQLEDVARRFNMTSEEIKDLLTQYNLDEESVRRTPFDLAGAQLDIRVAPEGISRIEIARDLYQDFVDAKQAVVGLS